MLKLAGVYIHIPFCKQLCSYCDFYFSVSTEKLPEMTSAILYEIESRKNYLMNNKVETLYIGGGTPSLLSIKDISAITKKVKDSFSVYNFTEFTIEVNPDDLSEDYLEKLAQTGVNRLSIGIQSFFDEHLTLFNRRHDGEQGYRAVEMAKKYFSNITLDLIYGVPGMTAGQWRENLSRFLTLDVPHLSAYHLTIEQKTVMGKRGTQPVDDAVSEEHYAILEEISRSAGYDHYEVSNFARKGFRAVHNSNYWRGIPYIGIGPSAHSFDGESREWNVSSNRAYMRGEKPSSEQLTQDDKFNEYVMTMLRTSDGIDYSHINSTFGGEKLTHIQNSAKDLIKRSLLEENKRGLIIPSNQWLLSDYVIGTLFF